MKRFLIYSLFAALPLAEARACISEGPRHNNYMFSVFHRNALTDGPAYLYDIDRYWQSYTGNNGPNGIGFYKWNKEEVMNTANSKGDHEMKQSVASGWFPYLPVILRHKMGMGI